MSDARPARRYKIGDRIGAHHSVLGVVDKRAGRNPIYIVWDHAAWCPMACKVFKSQARAEREASFLSDLAHPNVLRCFGLGDQAVVFLDFLEGPTLERLLDRQEAGRLSVANALRIAIHIGAALAYMHSKGVIYLDLSASNIILTPGGRPVLIDFGGARRFDEPRPSKVIGTDPYISPEECLQQPVTSAADVFGLGVLLFELLSGEHPFPKGTQGAPFPQIQSSPAELRKLRRGLPSRLEELVMSCLQRDPLSRPSLAALLPSLHACIRTGPAMWPAGFSPGDG